MSNRSKTVVRIGMVGDSDPERPTHQATNVAIGHATDALGIRTEVTWLATPTLIRGVEATLSGYDGMWGAPGSPYRSLDGARGAIRFAREASCPMLGTCGGFQHIVLE